jgi:hypothetical protein
MLAAHHEIDFLPETAFVRKNIAVNRYERLKDKTTSNKLAADLEQDKNWDRLNVQARPVAEKALAASSTSLDRAIYDEISYEHFKDSDVRYVGDKDPNLIEFLPVIFHHFKKSYILHVVRDPRDVVESKKRAAWSKHRHPFLHIFAGKAQFNIGRKFGNKLFGRYYKEVVYENLISDPEKELRAICKFLNIKYDSSMISSFGEAAQKLVADDEMSWKKETLGPILTSNIGKWKSGLSLRETAIIEKSCSEILTDVNASRSGTFSRLSFLDKLVVHFFNIVFKICSPLYDYYRYLKIRYHGHK